jgi:hypothetical protein
MLSVAMLSVIMLNFVILIDNVGIGLIKIFW